MADIKYYDVIVKPLVTEKTMLEMEEKKYTFYVHPSVNKIQIREAVEKMFEGVLVDKVRTITCKGKPKKRGNIKGKTPNRKKAIVKLKEGSKSIEIYQGL